MSSLAHQEKYSIQGFARQRIRQKIRIRAPLGNTFTKARDCYQNPFI
jgi:hypothetical protein